MEKIKSSEITPEHVYLNRRQFMKGIGSLTLGALALSACAPTQTPTNAEVAKLSPTAAATIAKAEATIASTAGSTAGPTVAPTAAAETDELGDSLTPFESVTNYNNFYEFSMDKEAVAPLSKDFVTEPWTLTVGGLVDKPRTFSVDDLVKSFPPEEHIYRLRCVEAWSMVIPWLGFSLASLLKEVQPQSDAKYVRFETLLDPTQMPGQRSKWYDWPYVEGLRLDEAMHPLTILSTGLYGKDLLPQNGAPLRLVVPWKYGFKSIKSIVKLDLVTDQPRSLWMSAAPNEYGFYANVNPAVPHPRWSQASERRIGELGRRPTLPFNGYAEEVASLYDGMDLRANY
jgi:sulfoxide reductase catalytic subunit YedY